MKNNRKVCILGHFGGDQIFLDGQTVKTIFFYDSIISNTDWKVYKIDTFYKKKHPFKLLSKIKTMLKECDDLFIMPSSRGLSLLLPFLKKYVKKDRIKIHHIVIGGMLPIYLKKHKFMIKTMIYFSSIWVETQKMADAFKEMGFSNIHVLPNFKKNSTNHNATTYNKSDFRFCLFSRIRKEKGVELAIEAIDDLSKEGFPVHLDIFGPIEKDYKARFESLLKTNNENVNYCGIVQQNNVVEKLSGYYALLFPTFWKGEGFAGTILDAFSSGIPVIASDWNCNSEIVTNNITGILYPNEKMPTLKDAIMFSINNKEAFLNMRQKCLDESKKYNSDVLIKRVIDYVELDC